MNNNDPGINELMREVYFHTKIIRKPISGIVSGYHDLPYIMVAPSDENPSHCVEVNGRIAVSPKFIISASALQESFGEVFDPETFDKDIEGRLFSFAYSNNRNLKVESKHFGIQHFEENADDHINRVQDVLMQQENTRTGLVSSPNFRYYPVSLDRFINEILEREFRV